MSYRSKRVHQFGKLVIAINLALAVTACGGSSDTNTTNITSPPPVIVTPEQCINQVYPIRSATDAMESSAYPASSAIDGNTSSQSRWSNDGRNAALILDLGSVKTLGALTIKWFEGNKRIARFSVETSSDNTSWTTVLTQADSSGRHSGFELVKIEPTSARYIKLIGLGNNENQNNAIVEVQAHYCQDAGGNFSERFPNELGIELIDWYLSIPTDEDNSGTADSIFETDLANGYTNSEFFYASADGGIVMRSPSYGFKTSANTSYVRVELREMLRRGDRSISTQGVNKNNWVFGSASAQGRQNAGGYDGDLRVKMAVNQVTTTGENFQIGRVIIGQIHANDDEPVRLYYRKLPGNERGAIYFAHESRVKDSQGRNIETYVDMIGSRSNTAANPVEGIALNEVFSYHISVNFNLLTVTISRAGKADVVAQYDMAESLYDQAGQYHYFKVGVYNVNNSSNPAEFVQATFYEIKNSHTGYSASE
ncbi:polysaccharide lyase family 7 protein [Alishewanella sp. 16-MA]|uniref:Polysaccharide lyase family 7 protein n=1 Tax=Alishewanella maricola TaxID=2795740 RepID=A0ABS8C7B6_9ALTE|nr:polysaccharide lyase family 7 protein [Alishewanella maricola]MCB5228191.1 polysaccharide lyase family 7 protein [Alishewanella maricola]